MANFVCEYSNPTYLDSNLCMYIYGFKPNLHIHPCESSVSHVYILGSALMDFCLVAI